MEYLALLKDIFIGGERYKYILNGLSFSVGTTALAAIIGIALGIFIALLQLSHFYPFKHSKNWKKFNPLSKLAFGYVDLIRGTPAVVQLMILANLIFVGSLRDTPILVIAAISFGINSGAYVAEIIRAGIEGLDKGQMEAARALGMNYGQSMKEIIIPQAVKKILPALVSEFITLLKETSIVGFIGGVDLLRSANIITSQTYRGVEPLLAVGFIYLIMTAVFTKFMRRVEKGLKVSD
ncbi:MULTISPECIES: amino acid ABC transporter permease [Fusobacterium]|jgi:His/Glu/Gln/Arg/opine family amino acid ABC transporter permease subunit|uniref:Amino acid ABC transporter permease n=2 Tax=Fusobacterium mortiferum TaxID=850 RepID=A0A414PUI9_FUSMR|nr:MULTISPECIES: amino acid ABC transporter permease [Fusobacterium]AVQ19430.1 amino acid ABC transporter permease [Fusobacterium mortiferum ATCC 9817]EEO36164.1 arginine ABC transporter, permease protein ArtQ [Fusobacterium mortiferum ATCC 9817]MCF2627901.1 amino acid ABC transporter permease [Fusobacterium mortiferum]MCF2698573.1 amino acid ABC transporter permease [Fusobacterium mortiferum]MCI7186699.1 amino acid ABC transporter permease [Fusobacterium mortiferum]